MTDVTFAKHPQYLAAHPAWRRHADLYEGDHAVVTQPDYLWMHAFERKADGADYFATRQQRTRYLGLIEILIEIWKGIFFRRAPDLDQETQDLLGDAAANIDGQGNGVHAFLKDRMLPHMLLFGRILPYVDSFPINGVSAADTEADRPFIDLLDPLSVVAWQLLPKRTGQGAPFAWLREEYLEIPEIANPEGAAFKELRKCRVYLLEEGVYKIREYQLVKKEQAALGENAEAWERVGDDVIPSRPHGGPLTEIPILLADQKSWVKDAAEEALRFHNLRSMYDNILLHQGYKKPFISAPGLMQNTQQIRALTEYMVGLLPENSTVLQIDPTDVSQMRAAMLDSLIAFFRVGLRKTRELPMDSRETMSAEAQAVEARNSTNLVVAAIGGLETLFNETLRLYALFMGNDKFKGKAQLSREVEFESVETQVLIYNTLADAMSKVPEWKKKALKRLAKFQNFGDDDYAEVADQIDAASFAAPANPIMVNLGGNTMPPPAGSKKGLDATGLK